jgi:hypothetical protein
MIDHEPIFRDRELNDALFREGYVTLPFLNEREIEKLKRIFYNYHEEIIEAEGLYISSHSNDDAVIQKISDEIQAVFRSSIQKHIESGMTLGGTFIARPPHQSEPLQPHQDWSIVDESRFRSFTIWIPLEDTNDDNGCIYVLPKSHEYVRGYRHVTIPSVFGPIYDTVWQYMIPVHLKAGEAIVFDHALGHASKPNRSDKIRIAATHSLISKDSEMRFYWNNNGVVEEFVGESGFYNTEEAKVGPGNLKKIGDVYFEMKQLDCGEFDTLAGIQSEDMKEPIVQKNWIQRLFT